VSGPKERVYDAEIAPLMARIIAVAREHGINMSAYFSLDPVPGSDVLPAPRRVTCRTNLTLDPQDVGGWARVLHLADEQSRPLAERELVRLLQRRGDE
jgi:hypothetical protein